MLPRLIPRAEHRRRDERRRVADGGCRATRTWRFRHGSGAKSGPQRKKGGVEREREREGVVRRGEGGGTRDWNSQLHGHSWSRGLKTRRGPCGEFTCGEFTCGEFPCGEFTCGVFTCGVFTCGEFTCGEFTCGEFTCGVFTCGEFTCGEFTCGEFTCGEFTCGEFTCGVFTCGVFTCGEFTCSLSDAVYLGLL
ncbi:hypothetical protein EYF80_011250 [Liparis tanakae]|uniref:Uncharacterized protein n=1 Tax=Liparis tanakae TaxID=230148 RepID=A0A4Z2IL42_9TELE|nr:hypothetical protein EYF80_011250 [Liparis tanakae]